MLFRSEIAMADPLIAGLNQRMDAYVIRERVELEATITHPVSEYQPGSPRLERLYEAMAIAQRFTFPSDYRFNL